MGIDYGRSGCGPFDGMVGRRWIGYYLTAYGLAVKHGFVGTEKEWLESLIGTDGKSVDLRYNEETNTLQWRHQDAEEEWADLLDISTLQTQIVAETLADANAAKIAAEQANTQAQGAKQSSAASAGQAADSAVQAKGSADAALESAAAAAKSEQSAKEYAGKPPIVQGDTWHTWNAESQSYTDTGIKASLTPKGEYSPDTAYTALDVVSYEGSSWLALKDVTGVAPAEGENWMLLAQKGDQGEQGIQGIQGIQGETGGPGPTGPQGASFTRLEKTAGTGAPGTTDTYTAYNSEGQDAGTVQVYNGMDGTGTGDFKADGTVPMTDDLQMGNHKLTGLAEGTADTDGVNKGQMDEAIAALTGEDIPTSGTDSTTIAAALSNKAESSYGMLQSVNILDWAKLQSRGGAFSAAPGCTGVPDSAAWYVGTLEVNVISGQWSLHLINTNTGEAFWNYTITGNWVDWTRIATATPPQEYDLPLAEGWNPYQSSAGSQWACTYSKDQFGIVHLCARLTTQNAIAATGTLIATIPAGFRPLKAFSVVCQVQLPGGGSPILTSADVDMYGQIKLFNVEANANSSTASLVLPPCSFVAAD